MSDRQAIYRIIRESQDPEICAEALRARVRALEWLLSIERQSCREWRMCSFILGALLGAAVFALIWLNGVRP